MATVRASRWVILIALGALPPGCRNVSKRTLSDTEGRELVARCDRDGVCELELTKGARAPDKTGLAIWAPGRLVGLCDTVGEKPPDAAPDCRALVCKSDESCPPAHGLKHGTCINGLCVEPANPVQVEDAVMLCLAGTGLGTTKPDRLALALNCGSPCRVPEVCRQP